MQHSDFKLLQPLISLAVGTGSLYLFCNFGKLATQSFQQMSDCVYNSNWQQFDIDLKKWMIFMIKNAQKPLHFHGYGMLILNLETFTQVNYYTFKCRSSSENSSNFFLYFVVDQNDVLLLHDAENFNTLKNTEFRYHFG